MISLVYIISGLLYVLSWRGLAYYYCLFNVVANVSIIMNLLQGVNIDDIADGSIAGEWLVPNLFIRNGLL